MANQIYGRYILKNPNDLCEPKKSGDVEVCKTRYIGFIDRHKRGTFLEKDILK